MLIYDRAIVISDLHLMENRPAITRAFFQLLDQLPDRTQALFILGDFFEYWVGDDAASEFHLEIADRLRALSSSIDIYLMVGNRDFAMRDGYAQRCGGTLIQDPTIAKLGGSRWLLSHGDGLCTDDKAYQRYRRIIQNRWVLGTLLRLPLPWRLRIAEKLRQSSKDQSRARMVRYVDVNESAVIESLMSTDVDGLVHGHTHMADWHLHSVAKGVTKPRLVLGDWYQHGWYLSFEPEHQQLHRFSIETGPTL
ncbi:UDP-2,3-diacylglucosamine diphosphatase [Saccharospirillum mangrovi]|uniref:UDP-2,3-diacylglucosamine diphosphatase n=1 Tax=Saccharospirillum mangrovi TaxID=2161747 RepID=UPI000D373082|nr:UDP-2,3-diacylglucosamine diphosphatase [Saccharospirillum mangrovi]